MAQLAHSLHPSPSWVNPINRVYDNHIGTLEVDNNGMPWQPVVPAARMARVDFDGRIYLIEIRRMNHRFSGGAQRTEVHGVVISDEMNVVTGQLPILTIYNSPGNEERMFVEEIAINRSLHEITLDITGTGASPYRGIPIWNGTGSLPSNNMLVDAARSYLPDRAMYAAPQREPTLREVWAD